MGNASASEIQEVVHEETPPLQKEETLDKHGFSSIVETLLMSFWNLVDVFFGKTSIPIVSMSEESQNL